MTLTIIKLLEVVKQEIESINPVKSDYLKSSSSFNGFEHLVSDILSDFPNNKLADYKIEFSLNFGHYFPDIDVLIDGVKYGIELKSRIDGSWKNNGGSVFESVSSDNYEEIFILFGTINRSKGEKSYKVRYAYYWQVAETIKVTHKPRYYLNMDATQSVFSSSSDYQKVRLMSESEKNKYVRDKLQETANKPTWYIADNDLEQVAPTLIKELPLDIRNRLISELMILFPQDLLKTISGEQGRSDYSRATEYLISSYFYYSPATRDLFSAGGKFEFQGTKFPKMIENYRENSSLMETIFKEQTDDFRKKAYASWKELPVHLKQSDIVEDFKAVLDHMGSVYLPNTLKSAKKEKLSEIVFHFQK